MKKQICFVTLTVMFLITACSPRKEMPAGEIWQPIPEDTFSSLITQYTAHKADNYQIETTSFEHPVTKEKGQAAIARKSQTGQRLSLIFSDIIATETLLKKAGWQSEPTLAADGPYGSQAGYWFENSLLIVRSTIEPVDGVIIPEDEPLDLSKLSPHQVQYSVEITGVRKKQK